MYDNYKTSVYHEYETIWFKTKKNLLVNEVGFTQGDGYCTTGRSYVPNDTVNYNF
jgi:hypothetical protein